MSQAKSPIAWSAHLKRTLQLGDSARESVNFPILIEFIIFKEMNEDNMVILRAMLWMDESITEVKASLGELNKWVNKVNVALKNQHWL